MAFLVSNMPMQSPIKPACNIQSVYSGNTTLDELVQFWTDQDENCFSSTIQLPSLLEGNGCKDQWKLRQKQYFDMFEQFARQTARQLNVPHFLSHYKGPKSLYNMWQQIFLEKQRKPCNAGNGVAAIDIDGNIYPCELFIGNQKWIIGHIYHGIYEDRLNRFHQEKNRAVAICKDCEISKDCPKSCIGTDPKASLIDNFKSGCTFAKDLVAVAKETYSVMLKNNLSL